MISIVGSQRPISHLPIGSLKLFGTNPYDEAIFRVVWSESRYYLVGANHTEYDGDPSNDKVVAARGKDPNVSRVQACYKYLPLYPSLKAWVLELWKSPLAFTGCTPEQWKERYTDQQSQLLILGPYPERGDFAQCFTFPSEPTSSLVHTVINRIRAGWNYSYEEHRQANKKEVEDAKKAEASNFNALMLDSQQAFKNRPSNVRPGKRTRDQIKLNRTADQVGLHKRGFATR